MENNYKMFGNFLCVKVLNELKTNLVESISNRLSQL